MFPAYVIIDYVFPYTGNVQRKRFTDISERNVKFFFYAGLGSDSISVYSAETKLLFYP